MGQEIQGKWDCRFKSQTWSCKACGRNVGGRTAADRKPTVSSGKYGIGECVSKKTRRDRKEAVLSQIQNETIYLAIKELSEEGEGSVSQLCRIAGIPRSSCYKWAGRETSQRESFNAELCTCIKDSYEETNGILGYRQMTTKLNRENEFHINQKRVLQLMKILGLKSVCRRPRKNYVKSTPEITVENRLNREFRSRYFGEKWLTDVTEIKYGNSNKAYLSAILDLADKGIVSFVIGHKREYNTLV